MRNEQYDTTKSSLTINMMVCSYLDFDLCKDLGVSRRSILSMDIGGICVNREGKKRIIQQNQSKD